MSSVPPVPSNVVPFPSRLSSGKRADLCSGQAFDLHRYCVDFQDRWTQLMNATFAREVDCAQHFGTSERAAAKWMAGIGGPRGDKVGIAVRTIPGAAEFLFGLRLAVAA
jgi:hypothetical protein